MEDLSLAQKKKMWEDEVGANVKAHMIAELNVIRAKQDLLKAKKSRLQDISGSSSTLHGDGDDGTAVKEPNVKAPDVSDGAADLPSPIDETQPPDWYEKLAKKNNRKNIDSVADTALQNLKEAMREAAKWKVSKKNPHNPHIEKIRNLLHQLPFEQVTGQVLRNHFMLHNKGGLPQLFDERYMEGIEYPFDIKADAKELYMKWCDRIFETDPLHGIERGYKGGAKDKLKRVGKPAHYHGSGSLVNGKWFPTQLAAVRDGAHGEMYGGIHGRDGEGAYSCIMAGSSYPDKDDGESVLYCGTDSKDGAVTAGTKRLLESEASGHPVRFFRSSKLSSNFAPSAGVRYDGLYTVVRHEKLADGGRNLQRHRFTLQRLSGQDPLRASGPPARPTMQEAAWCEKDRQERGYK